MVAVSLLYVALGGVLMVVLTAMVALRRKKMRIGLGKKRDEFRFGHDRFRPAPTRCITETHPSPSQRRLMQLRVPKRNQAVKSKSFRKQSFSQQIVENPIE